MIPKRISDGKQTDFVNTRISVDMEAIAAKDEVG
jgi:hypothetical protein